MNTVEKQKVALSSIHDFAAKLRQPDTLPRVKEYVKWLASGENRNPEAMPDFAPVSINLDLTTACNYACDHCVDKEILNLNIRYDHQRLLDSLQLMAEKGLKSVIVIGGGEPTTYPKFEQTIRFMKKLGLQVSIVSNGAGNKKIASIADCLDKGDWVRLSLDSGTDPTFQAMHLPKIKITLEEICAHIPDIKAVNSSFKVGFSYIVTWQGAHIFDENIVENMHEMAKAAALAKQNQFDYIAFKPFLTRAEINNAEVIDLEASDKRYQKIVKVISEQLDKASALEDGSFKIHRTTNLKMLLTGEKSTDNIGQPQRCHMQFFRQILSPLGTYNCPVYRNQPHGQLGEKDGYADAKGYAGVRDTCTSMIHDFNATKECENVTCLYNHVNWWFEDLIKNPEKLDALIPHTPEEEDYFL